MKGYSINQYPPVWASTETASQLTGLSKTYLRKLFKNGQVIGRRIGRNFKYWLPSLAPQVLQQGDENQ